jgi:hypothetical protein
MFILILYNNLICVTNVQATEEISAFINPALVDEHGHAVLRLTLCLARPLGIVFKPCHNMLFCIMTYAGHRGGISLHVPCARRRARPCSAAAQFALHAHFALFQILSCYFYVMTCAGHIGDLSLHLPCASR